MVLKDRNGVLETVPHIRVANKIKLINEISFNVPIYDFGTDQIAYYIPETNDWYLEFPEEITITY